MCVYSEHETLIYWYLVAVNLLIVILVIIVCVLRRKYTENQVTTRDRSNDTTVHTAESEGSYSSIAFKSRKKKSEQRNLEQRTFTAEDSVTYSSVAVSKPKSSASTDNEQDVNYSFIKIVSKNKTKSPKDVGDETIYSSMVC
ncbi:uncharacterized protein LOC108280614 [Ictalurus punctatus]|uniref:Uncharacterized protein LOC108280614 n=1 Tax=Ictalurus punctatus TaxID=7998 RepID=A0A9F7QTM9_ICTPU|nr:uncharacterized protein LOC108280614 [Ictalurus punctatus]